MLWYFVVRFLACTGARVSELIQIKAEHLHLGYIDLYTKGGKSAVCIFLMLVPSAYMQSMSAFVAQNMGAKNPFRAKKALGYGIMTLWP